MAAPSLYQSLSIPRPDDLNRGRTEGTKARETLDRDPDSALMDVANAPRAWGEQLQPSLYRALGDLTAGQYTPGETKRTATKETVDDDAEALVLDIEVGGGRDSMYEHLSVPAPDPTDPARTESTRVAKETTDNDRESDALASLLPLV